ncbi:MAG: hypothetical protein ACREBO_14265 [Novosphingobium sp.]
MTIALPKFGSLLAGAAALTLLATPAVARDGRWRHHHRDRVDAGDVFTGLLILGGIAAIASAASKADKDRRARDADRDADYRYPGEAPSADYDRDKDDARPQWAEGRGIDAAVDRCVAEVEEGERKVDEVETVNRSGEGWRIAGHMRGGEAFSCTVGRDGAITDTDVGEVVV